MTTLQAYNPARHNFEYPFNNFDKVSLGQLLLFVIQPLKLSS